MIADFVDEGVLAKARDRSIPANDNPPKAPSRKKLRRDMPSQNPCLEPQIVNMRDPPSGGRRRIKLGTKHQSYPTGREERRCVYGSRGSPGITAIILGLGSQRV
jgi:hypothetical protein